MKPKRLLIIGFAVLCFALIVAAYVQLLAMLLALAICAVIVLGFLWRGHKTRGFWISTGRRNDPVSDEQHEQVRAVRIEGREFFPDTLPPRLSFSLVCRNLHILIACTFIAAATVLVSLASFDSLLHPLDASGDRYFIWYLLCYALGILAIPAALWFSECALILRPGVTLASVHRQIKGGWGTLWIRYHFVDGQGGYHGGLMVNFGGPKDDHLKVVLCDPANPDKNRISCGFLFHKLVWITTPQMDGSTN